jgi:hypothetical protein
VSTTTRRFAVNSVPRPRADGVARRAERFDDYLTEVDPYDYRDLGPIEENLSWTCGVTRDQIDVPEESHEPEIRAYGMPIAAEGITGSQAYAITIEIETDYELFLNAGSNATTATNYITNLTGALATIYKRDLNVEVRQANLHIYTTVSDPWTATGLSGLNELANYYHTGARPDGRTTSLVAMLSGKNSPGGIAYEGIVGTSDFFSNPNWGGPYSWSGMIGVGGIGSVPDPNATNSAGTLYGMSSGTQNYWPLAVYSHEVGHNMGGHHTHCIQTSDAQRIASGFTDGSATNSTSNQVDHCYASEGLAACFAGANYVAGSQTIFKGTIMSYCHNVFVGGVPQSRFVFGVASEPSDLQYTDYMLRVGGPIQTADGRDGGSRNIVNAVDTFSLTVTAPATVQPSSTGNAASMTASITTGTTYEWTITNGTITAGQGTNAITFTAGASGSVTLRATAYRSNRTGISEVKAVTIQGASFSAPTGVTATAVSPTSVQISWNSVASATQYRIHRASSHGSFTTELGSSATTSFTDNTAVANTAYQYVVRAGDGTTFSTFSTPDFATTVIFTDPTLTAGSTTAKLVHFTQLLTAVNAMRTLTALAPIAFTSPTPTTAVTVRKAHIDDLRTGLNQARAVLGASAISYTDATITAGSTTIKAAHITQLRNGVQ